MKPFHLTILLFVSAFCGSLPAQQVLTSDPYATSPTELQSDYNGDACAYQVEVFDDFSWRNTRIQVHEVTENLFLRGNETERLSASQYVYLPLVAIDRLSVTNNILKITLTTVKPDKNILATRLGKKNPYVTQQSIRPACVLGAIIRTDYGNYAYTTSSAGSDLDRSVIPIPFNTPEEAERAFRQAQTQEGALSIKVIYNQTNYDRAFLNINQSEILDSEAYREFISPVQGRHISLDQARNAVTAVQEELDIQVVIDDRFSDPLKDEYFNFFTEQILGLRKVTLDWETAEKSLEDFSRLRYKSDVVTRLKHDASNLSDYQWCEKYGLLTDNGYHRIKERKGKSGGGIGIKSFKLGGNHRYNKRTDENVRDSYESNAEDCGRSLVERTNEFEIEGHLVTPRGIVAFEVVNRDVTTTRSNNIKFTYPRTSDVSSAYKPLVLEQYVLR